MACDLCGKHPALYLANIEAATLSVCQDCVQLGKPLKRLSPKPIAPKQEPLKHVIQIIPEIVEDYADLIKTAREHMGLSQTQLAIALNEKESVIHKLETSHVKPPIMLAKKIEKYLHIRLVEEIEETRGIVSSSEHTALTIGDIIRIKNQKYK
ncbi:MAG: multiprotein bridging factor aMBF1 [Nanoarchaeota archaeon]